MSTTWRCVALAVVILVACPAKGATPPELDGFADEVERIRLAWEVPGLAVAVVRGSEVVFLEGFGVRNLESGIPVTPRTLFAIGSCSKSFGATTVVMASEDGHFELDQPVADVLPCFRLSDGYASLHATPRDLLSHRTGVPGVYGYLFLRSLGQYSRAELCTLQRHLPANAELRQRYQYNSLMYIHASHLVEHVTGMDWETYLGTRLLDPLGMERTTTSVAAMLEDGDFAVPYLAGDNGPEESRQYELATAAAAGGICSSAEEMARWLLLHLGDGSFGGHRLISEEALQLLHTPHTVNPHSELMGPNAQYALGWQVTNHRGRCHLEHGGHIGGYSAWIGLLPDDDIGVVVLSNRSFQMAINVVMRRAYDRLLNLETEDWEGHFRDLYDRIENPLEEESTDEPTQQRDGPPSLPLEEFAGSYDHPAYGAITIEPRQGELAGRFMGRDFALEHERFNVFTFDGSALSGTTVRFELDDDGLVRRLVVPVDDSGVVLSFERL